MKTGYLAYAIYNLDDGADFSPLGVYGDEDTAIDMLVTEMETYSYDEFNDDEFNTAEAYEELHDDGKVYLDDYDSKFAYTEIKVEL